MRDNSTPSSSYKQTVVSSQLYEEEVYWTDKLAGEVVRSAFPCDWRKTKSMRKLESVKFSFTEDLFSRLIKLSNESDYRLYMILAAGVVILLNKYTGNNDIILGTPTMKQDFEADFINTALPLRTQVGREDMTFKELLLQLRQTIVEANDNQNYPLEQLLHQLGMAYPEEEDDFPLFDVAVLLENIQDKKYIQHININMIFSFLKADECIEGSIEYSSSLYRKETVARIFHHLGILLKQAVFDVNLKISEIELILEEEKTQILLNFNNTGREITGVRTIHQLIEEQVEKTPGHTSIRHRIDVNDFYEETAIEKLSEFQAAKFGNCCFKKNPYIFVYEDNTYLEAMNIVDKAELAETRLIRTHKKNYAAVNILSLRLLDYFDEKTNLKSIFEGINKDNKAKFIIYPLAEEFPEVLKAERREYTLKDGLKGIVPLVQALCKTNLIAPVDFIPGEMSLDIRLDTDGFYTLAEAPHLHLAHLEKFEEGNRKDFKSPVLLLGDTTGTASSGILYLASFLRRNGIEAYCQWNWLDRTNVSLKEDIEHLLADIQPRLVGISMKWFLHIARVLAICKIVKEYDSSIEIVIGGDTAGYYKKELIENPWIDYIISGDGEVPLLKICLREDNIPNCMFKENGKIIETPIHYVQNEKNHAEIFLSHLEKIFISTADPYLSDSFYINTGKGCSLQCFYCAGCRDVQKKVFNREKPFLRDVDLVRKDIIEVKKYTTTFMFDFDLPLYNSIEYYRKIWGGMDLSCHFCEFYFWQLPSLEFLDLVSRTFKYVYLNIDVCSLSSRHRKELEGLKLVKPQPNDHELFSFFDMVENYNNLEVKISQIAGLPYFSLADINESNKALSKLIGKYSRFCGISWGRLHAQPGSLLNENCEKHNMYSYARSFEDFLHYSELNLKEEKYPDLVSINYPYIYYKDDHLNSRITEYYFDSNEKIRRSEEEKRKQIKIYRDLTYRELDGWANQLAAELRKTGVTPNSTIAMLVRPSVEMIIDIVGILKAGGAYLPIDANYPPERIKYIIKDSNVNLILTNCPKEEILSYGIENAEIIDIELKFASLQAQARSNLDHINTAEDLAYVIYTSGTTGNPKGVAVGHSSAVNTLVCRKDEYKMDTDTTSLQLFSYAFDGFVTSFFTPLISGAKIIIPAEEEIKDVEKLREITVENRVTHFISVPGFYRVLLEYFSLEDTSSLRVVALAGDVLTPDIIDSTIRKNEKIEIAHEYGVTEAAVMSTICRHQEKRDEITIGKPIWNSLIYILNELDQLQPIGVSGELCISGAGVARGYLNKPELTNERFTANPLKSGEMLYRTGDLAKWLPDGNIEFLGRIDHQVKIRGFRIELAEIENKLLNYKDVKEAVVTTRERENGDKFLCAYYVGVETNEKVPDTRELREFLAGELPEYMIPAYFINLEKIPLTTNGKLDRKALPDPLEISSGDKQGYIPPGNAVERELVEIWQKVLGRKEIGVNENFFMIGGDSIKSIQILSRMSQVGYKIEMRELFQYPTISELALRVKKFEHVSEQSIITGIVPLTPVQKWFFDRYRTDAHHFNQAVMFYSREGFAEGALKEIFTKIQQQHDVLRMSYKEEKGEIVQINHGLDYPFSLDIYDFRNQENSAAALEAKANEIQASIDLETGPLMKLGLFHLDDGDRLLITVHHLVIDGVSLRILLEDIETLYRLYQEGEQLTLPLKTDSFKVWAEKLSEYANSERFLKEKSYWVGLESTNVPPIEKDFQEKDNYRKDAKVLSFSLNEQETNKLLTKVNDAFGTEINDILLSALGIGIKKTWHHDRILISLEGHGREEIIEGVDISRTFGWFTSGYPLILDVSYEDDLGRQIKEVKEAIRKIPNKGIGYGILKYLTREEYKKDIEFILNPQIGFNYLGQFDADIEQMSFDIAKESAGNTMSLAGERGFEFDISGMIANNRLVITITYNEKHYRSETVETLLTHFHSQLIHIVDFCFSRKERELTPSDFTYKGLSIEAVDRLGARYAIEDIYLLTPMQEGMLFYALYDDSSFSYFEQTSYRLHGELDTMIVEKSLNVLFKRHDILRTAFIHDISNRPIQLVLKDRHCDFYYKDIREIAGIEEREAFVSAFKAKDKRRFFDLSKDVLMRVSVLYVDTSEYEVIWSFHPILMDGWGIGILISDFFEIYNSYLENRPLQLGSIKPYRTYIQWLEQQDREASKNYWLDYLDSYEEVATIPKMTAHNDETEKPGFKNEQIQFTLDLEKTNRLNMTAGRNNVTVNIILQAVWAIILGRYNGKEDVVFGGVVSGRPFELEGVESMVGLFINTIPIRIRFNGNMKFTELLQTVQKDAIASEPHHYHPLAEIQSGSLLKQNLIDHLFIFENYPIASRIEGYEHRRAKTDDGGGLEISNIQVFEQNNYNFNMILILRDRLYIRYDYNANIYDRNSVERIFTHFKKMLEQITDNEELKIGQLTILTNEERKQILCDFNNTEVEYAKDKTIHQLFEEQVERTPDHIAIVDSSPVASHGARLQISYRKLNKKSNQLAGYLLRELSIQQDTLIGILLERSGRMVVSILAVWKAGGAYIPLDTEYPLERIDSILQDSRAAAVITDDTGITKNLRQLLKIDTPIICLEELTTKPEEEKYANPNIIGKESDLAYVIYTSGSTGRPKGVMVEQVGMLNHIYAKIKELDLDAGSVIAQNASHCFDISVWQFFAALVVGGKTAIYRREVVLNIGELIHGINNDGITVLEMVPSHLSILLEIIDAENEYHAPLFQSLEYLVTTGETIKPTLVNRWFKRFKSIRVVNAYGPTEASDDITHYIMSAPQDTNTIPVGSPLPNFKIYMVDRELNLCPIGLKGEILVSGIGVGRGYLNDINKTHDAFMKDPFREEAGIRLYKTGDIGRYLKDGRIEFFGRKDYQVKIKGFRIELGEIDSRLSEFPGIKEAVTICRENENGDKYLCSYIVSDRDIPLPLLREYLSKHLPDYMIPSYFVFLDKIPLNPNGKLDRKALPEPEVALEQDYTAPRNEIEEKLVKIWSDVLGRDALHASQLQKSIGIDNNFFESGGHSLKATILTSRIYKEFDVQIPLVEFFKTPTIKGLAEYMLRTARDKFESIESAEKKEYYSLSSAQKRLYILYKFEEKSTAYNLPNILSLEGNINKDTLEETFRRLISRHQSLKTSFEVINDEPVQKIHDDIEFEIEYYEALQVEDIIKNFIRPFDLSKAPLLRVGLIKEKDAEFILMIDIFHIVTDGTSQVILTKEFMALYAGEELPLLKLKYKDYSEKQQRDAVKEALERQEKFWLQEFSGEIPTLNLPTDYIRPSIQSFEGSRSRFELDEEKTALLNALAQSEGATIFMIILAVLNLFLSKVSGQEDILVGIPIAGRRHPDLEKIIGMFVNTLALRNYPSGEKTFASFLSEVREMTLKAFENQDYQFEDLVEKIVMQRDLSRNPLFDVMFTFQNMLELSAPADVPEEEMGGVKIKPYDLKNRTSKFDLMLNAVEGGGKLFFLVEYCTKLFREETISGFIRYFKQAVSSVLKKPGTRISEIEIISEEERNQLLYEFNNTETGYPVDKVIHELFEEQAERTPDHIAVVGPCIGTKQLNLFLKQDAWHVPDIQLTYRELNEKSNRLAFSLRDKGVVASTILGILMHRSIEMIIGIFGILKSGSAYLPIDPDYPQERIQYILSDSGAEMLLTDDDVCWGESMYSSATNVGVRDVVHLHLQPVPTPGTCLAYIIYTSGSTGKPKGVMVEHRSVVNLVYGLKERVYRHENSVAVALVSPIFFDASIKQIFPSLVLGHKLVIVSEIDRLVGEKLIHCYKKNNTMISDGTPAHLMLLLDSLSSPQPGGEIPVQRFVIGGEFLKPSLVCDLMEVIGRDDDRRKLEVVNAYGPTECCDVTSTFTVTRDDAAQYHNLPVGTPLDNFKVYIVGKGGRLQPPGISGELCVSGDGLARGYVNRPELTIEKFAVHPFEEEGRLYSTGDLAKWLPDGNIEFLGRLDHQVKIRGFRIEVAEIETRLVQYAGIKEVVVICRNDGAENNYLCAYIVSDYDIPVSVLREYLSKYLPDYMIPSYFSRVEKIPLTPNGKIDRKLLPAPEIKTGDGFIAPRNEEEEKLAEIWSEVLRVEKNKVGIDSNFFELGGHSLKAAVMTTKIHKEFNVKLPLTEVFKTSTIRRLSGVIKGLIEDKYEPIALAEQKEYYALSSAQKRLYALHQLEEKSTRFNMSAALRLEGPISKNRVNDTFNKMIKRHESFRTSFEIRDAVPVQVVHDTVGFAIEYYDLSDGQEGLDVEKIFKHFFLPFDLSKPPILRVGMIKMADDKHILMIGMHHIISDGTSMRVVINEFMVLYAGEELPRLRLRYRDFSEWQNHLFESGEIKKQRQYWLNQFKGDIPVLNMPLDYPRPAIYKALGNRISFELDGKITAGINRLIIKTETTMYIMLLAAYNILLSKYSRQEDIIVGTPVAGRRDMDLENMIGIFINMLAMKNQPRGEMSFTRFLDEVKINALDAFDNQDYQFESLVWDLGLKTEYNRNPLFDAVFVLQNTETLRIKVHNLEELSKIKVFPYEIGIEKVHHELLLNVMEKKDRLSMTLEYSTELFKESTAQKMVKNYLEILEQIVEKPEIRLQDIKLSHGLTAAKPDTIEIDQGDFIF